MPDISQLIGSDLVVSAGGDLLTSDSLQLSTERVLRRLLTNPGDYIFHPDYGAGLPKLVGSLINIAETTALIKAQMFLEASVVQNPPPIITVTPIANGMFVEIQYTEADSQLTASLSFSVNG